MAPSRRPRRAQTVAPTRSSHRPLLFVALITAAVVITYANSVGGPFIWDDQTAVQTNQTIHGLWSAWIPPHETPVAGRPVVNLSLALNYAVGGLDVTGYHLGNIALHLACALLLFGIVRRTLLPPVPAAGRGMSPTQPPTMGPAGPLNLSADTIALVAALLWAVHPLQSEVVDYVTQRTESTMALFYFLTLYCAIRGRRSNGDERGWDIAAVLSCLLGMASKETMVTAPLVVAAYDRVFEFGSLREAVRARARLYAGLAATWAALGLLMWQAARSTVGASATVGPWTYLLNQCQVLTAYLGLLVWPRALVLDYGLPRVLSFGDIAVQALLIGVLVATALVAWTRWPKVGFLAGTFFLTIAPSSSVLPVLTEVGAERRMYLPSAALTVLAVVAGWWVLQRLAERYPRRAHVLVVGAGAVVCCAAAGLAARTMLRNREYASPVTLWRTVVDRRPHGRAHYGLGTALVDAERHDEAIAELRRAATDFPNARFALGTELFASGQYEEAVSTLRTFIRDQPERPERIPAQLLLGHALMGEGQLNDAAREFQALLDANPSNVGARDGLRAVGFAHRDLAATLVRQQRADAAVAHAREAVRLLPTDAATRNLLGAALASSGRVDEGVAQFQQALALDPTSQQTRNNLAHALALVRATGRQR